MALVRAAEDNLSDLDHASERPGSKKNSENETQIVSYEPPTVMETDKSESQSAVTSELVEKWEEEPDALATMLTYRNGVFYIGKST